MFPAKAIQLAEAKYKAEEAAENSYGM